MTECSSNALAFLCSFIFKLSLILCWRTLQSVRGEILRQELTEQRASVASPTVIDVDTQVVKERHMLDVHHFSMSKVRWFSCSCSLLILSLSICLSVSVCHSLFPLSLSTSLSLYLSLSPIFLSPLSLLHLLLFSFPSPLVPLCSLSCFNWFLFLSLHMCRAGNYFALGSFTTLWFTPAVKYAKRNSGQPTVPIFWDMSRIFSVF